MTTAIRDLGGTPVALLQANEIDFCHLVRLTLPNGTKHYWTDRHTGFTGQSIDGELSSVVWEPRGFNPGSIKETQSSPLDVSWVALDNLDYAIGNLAQANDMKRTKITVYKAWFDPSTGAFAGAFRKFDGRIDDGTFGQVAQLTLAPNFPLWAKVPGSQAGTLCVNIYRHPRTCKYVGGEPGGEQTCNHTRGACAARLNLTNFNGDDLAPSAGGQEYW